MLYFTPAETTTALISVCASGFDSRAPLAIAFASAGSLSSGTLVLNLEKGRRMSVEIGFSVPYQGPVELSAVAVSGGG